MIKQEYTKQVAIAYAVESWRQLNLGRMDYIFEHFTESKLFKSIPQPEPSIPVSKIQKRIDWLKSTKELNNPNIVNNFGYKTSSGF